MELPIFSSEEDYGLQLRKQVTITSFETLQAPLVVRAGNVKGLSEGQRYTVGNMHTWNRINNGEK